MKYKNLRAMLAGLGLSTLIAGAAFAQTDMTPKSDSTTGSMRGCGGQGGCGQGQCGSQKGDEEEEEKEEKEEGKLF
jgi:hypothetical protein